MKKNIYIGLIILLCFIVAIKTFGQRKKKQVGTPRIEKVAPKTYVVDSGEIKIWYAFCATDIKDTKTYDDFQILEIGERYSKYYSWFWHNSNSLIIDYIKKNPSASVIPKYMGPKGKDVNWSEYSFSEYYKDNYKKTFSEYTKMPYGMKFDSYYVEPIPEMKWTIQDETKTIAEYTCQKAICHFRGRDFVAWFTVDIPYNNGPWKFGGLPGLILKVTDTNNLFDFECVKIESFEKKYPITKYEKYKNYKKLDREKHLKLQKNLNEDWTGTVGLIFVEGSQSGQPKPNLEYDALELE